jgi:hypothetical protein
MSTSVQGGQLEESPEDSTSVPRQAILSELSLSGEWAVEDDPEGDDLLLVNNRDQERWQSISLSISHRKNGDKIQSHYRKAPYRRGRVGSDPVERETHDTWTEAVDWIRKRL